MKLSALAFIIASLNVKFLSGKTALINDGQSRNQSEVSWIRSLPPYKVVRDFKAALMYFSEPFLQGATLNGTRLEGETSDFMATKIVNSIEILEETDKTMAHLEDLVTFKTQLKAGIEIHKDIADILSIKGFDESVDRSKSVQERLCETIKQNNGIILPSGWLEHAIVIIIKPGTKENTFDLAVVNTGDGIEFHYNCEDPNGIYPFLSLPWIQFSGIPIEEIFSSSAWFIQGLVAINDYSFINNLKKSFHELNIFPTISDYFYGSFLANFMDYLVDFKESSKQRLIVMQRSGSCTLSSLMAALLFESKEEETFYFYRLKLGNFLIRDLLMKAEGNLFLKDLITDGFDSNGRKFFRGLASSLAQQTLQYLEFAMPENFKHAGLIGSERSSWLPERKEAAIEALKASKFASEIVQDSYRVCRDILQFLTDNPIRKSTNIVKISERDRQKLAKLTLNNDLKYSNNNYGEYISNFYNFLAGTPDRLEASILDFDSFNAAFAAIDEKNDSKYFIRLMDLFKRAHNGDKNWWNIFTSASTLELLQLQNRCRAATLSFATSKSSEITSFDDISMLAHLQRLSWELALAIDNNTGLENRIGLNTLSPPKTLQNVLFGHVDVQLNVLAGNAQKWSVHNIFDIQSYQMFKELLEEESELDSFMGPEAFSNFRNNNFSPSLPSSSLSNELIYRKIMNHSVTENAYAVLTSKKSGYTSPFQGMIESKAKFLIVFLKQESNVVKMFPHYYNLMDTLANVRIGAIQRGNLSWRDYWVHFTDKNKPDSVELSFKIHPYSLPKIVPEILHETASIYFKMASFPYSKRNCGDRLFYNFRHSEALTENINIISIETWLNYVKTATSAKIFDSFYFQYMTDHLLNVPKFDKQANLMFPIDKITAETIIYGLHRLISISLINLNSDDPGMTTERRKTFVLRSVNISVILTRFIERIDYENILSGSACARALATVYNTIIPFAKFATNFGISEVEISKLNFALCHVSSVRIRNSLTFMENIELYKLFKSETKLRKTLVRYHWFAAKRSYLITHGAGSCVADDQFMYGITGSSLNATETDFLQELLFFHFLSSQIDNPIKLDIFKYHSDGAVLEMHSSEDKDVSLMINIWTSSVVKNGLCLVQSSNFINSDEFQVFFNENDRDLASNGTTLEISGKLIYILPDFKGSSYFFVQDAYKFDIYRKWNGLWFFFDKDFSGSGDQRYPSYSNQDWTKNLKLFSRFETPNIKRTIGFSGDSTTPIYRIVQNEESNELKLAIGDFVEDDGWLLIDYVQRDEKTGKVKTPREYKLIQKHLGTFAQNDFVAAIDEAGKIIVICPLYRLAEDPNRPLIFKEVETNLETTEFEILNVPGMKVSLDQTLGGQSSLPGGLIVTADSKKLLLLPLCKIAFFREIKQLVEVQKIPIVNEYAVPQSRLHKLLLAYVLMSSHNYNSALELLNPKSSIVLNEQFTLDELEIFTWISGFGSSAPEIITFEVLAYIHFKLCLSKFPTVSYIHDKRFKDSMDQMKYTKYYAITNYLLSVRDLSEKYYIHKILPEVLDDEFFSELMYPVEKSIHNMIKKSESTIFTTIEKNTFYIPSCALEKYDIGSDLNQTIFFSSLIGSKSAEMIELIAKLTPRRFVHFNFSENYAMAAYCYLKEPELLNEIKEKLYKCAGLTESNNSELFEIIDKNMKEVCIPKYKKYFNGINQSREMTSTSLDVIKATMQSDVKMFEKYSENLYEKPIELVTPMDLSELAKIKIMLQKLIKNNEKFEEKLNHFDRDIIDTSKVLKSLESSITKFVQENGISGISQVEFQGHPDLLQNLKDLQVFLEGRINDLELAQANSSAELVEMTSADIHSNILSSILSHMHQKKTKTFSNLYACYLRNSASCIQKKFPGLTPCQSEEVKVKGISFFGRKILIDYFGILKRNLNNFFELAERSEPVSADDLSIFCDELSKVENFNFRIKDPVIMNFEFRSEKYRLKPEQVKDIDLLTTEDEHTKLFTSIVIQRMMAAGKTLVLGTISVVKKALSKTKLSILVPPASLYQSNMTAMQARTYQYFKKKGEVFNFPRHYIPKDSCFFNSHLPSYLKTIHNIIKRTMNDSNYLILSPDSLSSFLNSYIEVLLKYSPTQNYSQVVSMYAKIYSLFKKHGSIILDEIDMTMDPKKELNFPTEESEPYNMTAVTFLADIIEFMLFDGAIIKSGLQIHSNDQASLTSNNYKNCRELILDYIERELRSPSSIWYKYIFENANHKETVETFMGFLSDPNMTAYKDWMISFHGSGNEIIANALIIVKFQIYQFLEYSLKGTVNLNYGSAGNRRPDIKYAVPFVAANTPSASSVFADRWETLLKTLIMISASPCSFSIAEDIIEYIRKAMLSESAGTSSFKHTPTYQNVILILPENFNPMTFDKNNRLHVKILQAALALRSPAAIRILFGFYINQVFEKMTFPTEQISSNALNLASMFSSVQGYSGTIDNVNILPQTVIKHAFKDHEDNEKNNGGISLKLIKDSNDEKVGELNESSFKKSVIEMVQDLIALYPSENVNISAIIDAAAFFKTFKNRQVAESILIVFESRIKAVLYYDEDSNQLEFLRSSVNGPYARGYLETTDPDDIKRVTQVELSERFTFYDQRHITGSDILQPKTAHAIMTTGPRVLLRDILQGALRMRQFMTSQKVHLVTTEASRNFYASKIMKEKTEMRVSDVLTLGALNEDDKQEQENEKLAYVKIDAEIRAFILDEVSRCFEKAVDVEECTNVVKLVQSSKSKSLFLRSIREVPLDLLRATVYQDTQKTLQLFAISRLTMINKLIPRTNQINDQVVITPMYRRFNNLKRIIKDMISIDRKNETDSLLFFMKETVNSQLKIDGGTEVQLETLNLALSDVNIESLTTSSEGTPAINDYNLLQQLMQNCNSSASTKGANVTSFSYISLDQLYNHEKFEKDNVPYLRNTLITSGKRIGVTLDLIKVFEPSSEDSNPYPIFSKFTFEGSHLLLHIFNNNLNVILVSPKHATKLIKDFSEIEGENQFWLCDLSGSVTATTDSHPVKGQNVLDFIPESKNLIFDLLIFNGSLAQIISNPILMDIYITKWLQSDHFRERAIFLKLRMYVLRQKDAESFDDDDKYLRILNNMTMGQKNPIVGSMVCGYPKGPVEITFEESIRERFDIVKQNILIETRPEQKIDFDINKELGTFFIIRDDQENTPTFGLPEETHVVYENLDFDTSTPEISYLHPREVIHIVENDVINSQVYGIEPEKIESIEYIAEEIEYDEIDQVIVVEDLSN